MPTYSVHGYRAGRDEPFEAHAARVWGALSALAALSPRFGPWWRRDVEGAAPEPVGDVVAAAGALGARAVRWVRAGRAVTSWCPEVFAGDEAAPWCSCSFAVGVALPELPGVFAPERLALRMTLAGDDALARPDAVGAALAALATSFGFAHGHAGGGRFPAPRTSLVSDGAPVAGWMTWLGAGEAPLPAVLPPPLVARAQPDGATMVVAVGEAFREDDRAHRGAVRALAEVLAGAR